MDREHRQLEKSMWLGLGLFGLVFHSGCDVPKILMNTSDHQAVESLRYVVLSDNFLMVNDSRY